jgi:hypothetical protein
MFNSSVVIVTYNRLGLLKECLQCIEQQEKKFDYVVVVNNASTDGTSEFLKQFEKKYHVLTEKENGGGAKGFMDGVKYVHENLTSDWILLIDDDAMLCDTYLKELEEYTTKFPMYKAFSGSVKTDGEIDITHRKYLRRNLSFDIIPVPKSEYEKEYFEYNLATFCGVFFSAKLIDKIGVPKGEYFIWYDDTEYSLRIGRETRILNINSIYINHKTKKGSPNNKLNWRGYYGIRNRGDVIRTYGTNIQYRIFRIKIFRSMIKNLVASWIIKNRNYDYNYRLYKDALTDMKNRKFGFNTKYSFDS